MITLNEEQSLFIRDSLENELIDLIRDTCRYQNIKCEDKLNQAMEIFEGEII